MQDEGATLLYPSRKIVVPELGVHHVGLTQLYELGSKAYTTMGTWYYCYFTTAMKTGLGAKWNLAIGDTGVDWSALVQAQQIGDHTVQMTNTVALTANKLKGGWICINTVPPDAANAMLQQRGIIGNTASAANGTVTITLDEPLTAAVTTSSYAFAMGNPFSDVSCETSTVKSHIGLPAVYTTAAGYYGFVQTRGFCWISDYAATLGKTANQRQLVWDSQGALAPHLYSLANHGQQQHAGFIVDDNTGDNGASLIYLTGID